MRRLQVSDYLSLSENQGSRRANLLTIAGHGQASVPAPARASSLLHYILQYMLLAFLVYYAECHPAALLYCTSFIKIPLKNLNITA